MIRVMFVCHGNICRSPMAEYVLEDMIKKNGLEGVVEVASAATSREEIGNDIHWGTRDILDKHGIAHRRRRARQIERSDYDAYDYIVCMDDMNIRNCERVIGQDWFDKIYKLMDFADVDEDCEDVKDIRFTGRDVADPWYTGNFVKTYEDVVAGCSGIISLVKSGKML
ncbi:MAG TPA: low molecular weight phosphotyrosine protein phosphatase [Eubacterium sp.]|nr:low molecular weight phosphotyrosine protein phosphatase [Eubacterium sp.]